MSHRLSIGMFDALMAFSANTALVALSNASQQRDLESLAMALDHFEAHGFKALASNTHQRVYPDDMDKTNVQKAKDTPFIAERITRVLARFVAPELEESEPFGKTTMWAQDFWTPRHEALFDRTIAVIREHGDRAMLGDFAFDVVSLVPHASCMQKLLDAGAKPGETGQTPCDTMSHDMKTLTHEAFIWGNLAAAEVLVKALPDDKFPALAKNLLDENGFWHAIQKEFSKHNEVAGVHKALTADESMHPQIDRLLRALDEKDLLLGTQFRGAVLKHYFERAIVSSGRWSWSEKGVALLMGAAPGQDLATTPLAKLSESLDPTRKALDTEENSIHYGIHCGVGNAIAAHCAPYIKAFPHLVRLQERHESFVTTLGRAVNKESMRLAVQDAIRPGTTDRFIQTVRVLMDLGIPIVHPPEHRKDTVLHMLALNTRESDRSAKLPILLSLGANPDAKNRNGNKPRMLIKDPEQRPRWDHIVQTHQARAAAYSAMAQMDADLTEDVPRRSPRP